MESIYDCSTLDLIVRISQIELCHYPVRVEFQSELDALDMQAQTSWDAYRNLLGPKMLGKSIFILRDNAGVDGSQEAFADAYRTYIRGAFGRS